MSGLPYVLYAALVLVILGLMIKIVLLRKAAEELRQGFEEGLKADSNTGITISTNDRKMKRLAADMNRQLKLLRKEHIRYVRGDQELKNAVTGISHDLRTPLTAICGYMDLLAQEDTSETVREYLAVIDNRVQAMKELTEELFRYSIILSAESGEEWREISLNAAIEESMAAYYGALKAAGIEPEISMPEAPVLCRTDLKSLARILANIISNAVKYSDGDLRVILKEDGSMYFSNRAENLDEVQVGHLFDRFFTVQDGKNATGLGLSIARTLAEKLQGKVEAEYRDGRLEVAVFLPVTAECIP